MPASPADHLVVLSLLTTGVFFTLAATFLRWSAARTEAFRCDEAYLWDQLSDESPWLPQPSPAPQSPLQVVDGSVGASRVDEARV